MSTKDPEASSLRSPAIAKITRGHSCLLCSQRKIKCSGQKPCSACVKARVECVTKPNVISQRRKAKMAVAKEDILSRLQRCEEQLRMSGAKSCDDLSSKSPERSQSDIAIKKNELSPRDSTPNTGSVISNSNSHHYVNNPLWDGLLHEVSHTKEILRELEEEIDSPETVKNESNHQADYLLFGQPALNNLRLSHPQPVQIFRLWQICLDNVNPMVKLFHAPTVQQMILEASSSMDKLSTSTEALMFAIYLIATVSLSDEECKAIMGESRATVLLRLSNATQQALVNAKVLRSSNMVVLQAFTLFLLAMRPNYDFQTFWALTGLAIRCGERIGLHRESANQTLTPFEGEIRTRLWRQILTLDARASQLAGASWNSLFYFAKEVRRPLNVNDSDLNPAMKELPPEHIGATEMLFCSLRCEMGEYMYKTGVFRIDDPAQQQTQSLAEKDEAIGVFANRLEEKFLKYCDTSIPFHLFVACTIRTVLDHARLNAHHPRQYPDRGASLPQEEKDMLLKLAMSVVDNHNVANSTKCLRGFLWHINVFFPFEAFVLLLGDLCQRTHGELTINAWRVVSQVYDWHPELISNTKNAVYLAVGNLAIKAWENCMSHESLFAKLSQSAMPPIIAKLCSLRKIKLKEMPKAQSQGNLNTELRIHSSTDQSTQCFDQRSRGQSSGVFDGADPSLLSECGVYPNIDPIDWDYWQALLDNPDYAFLDCEQS